MEWKDKGLMQKIVTIIFSIVLFIYMPFAFPFVCGIKIIIGEKYTFKDYINEFVKIK